MTSILPLAPELNMILRRVFETDPTKRIGMSELRQLILACPRFTASSYHELPPTPVQAVEYVDTMDCANMALPPSPPSSPKPSYQDQISQWSLFPGQDKRSSGSSTSSVDSGYGSDTSISNYPLNIYGNIIPFDHEKQYYQQYQQPAVAVF